MNGPKYDRQYLITQVAMMRAKGKSTRFIIEFLQKDVKMGETTAYEIMKDAQKVFIELQKTKIEGALEESLTQLEEIFESTSDKKLRLEVIKEINKLKGLYIQRIEHTGSVSITGLDIQIITNKKENEDEK